MAFQFALHESQRESQSVAHAFLLWQQLPVLESAWLRYVLAGCDDACRPDFQCLPVAFVRLVFMANA